MGDKDTPAGDVFSLGVTLYELLAMEGFGKIFIRGEKYDAALNERIDNLDLSDLGQARATQVRQVLHLMLSYEPEVRPTAQVVVELMEALAEEIQDGSIRRFCREIVKPAYEKEDHPGNPNDPFTGSTLFEDSSRIREEAIEEVEKRVSVDLDPVETGVEYTSDVQDAATKSMSNETMELPIQDEGQFEHTEVGDEGFVQTEKPYPVPESPPHSVEPAESTGSAVSIGLAVFGLLLGVGVLFGGYSFLMSSKQKSDVPEIIVEELKYLPGGVIETGQANGEGGTLKVNLTGMGSAKVTISGGMNDFTRRWDGTGTLELTDLRVGTYRLRLRTTETTQILDAQVERGKVCTYRYNLESEGDEWDASGC